MVVVFFFEIAQYTSEAHNACTHTHPYKRMYTDSTSISIFEDWTGKSSKLTKTP